MGERMVDLKHPDYPQRLRDLRGPDRMPEFLWLEGAGSLNPQRSVAIVGTRSPLHLSSEAAQAIGRIAAALGQTVVSGYATGIDTAGHWGAMDAEGQTIAVLGSGIRRKEPFKPALARLVLGAGVFVSELADPEARRAAGHLMARNRIVAALADTIIVVETGPDGGAADCAKIAKRLGRGVYAVVWGKHQEYGADRRGGEKLAAENIAAPLQVLDPQDRYIRADLEVQIRRILLSTTRPPNIAMEPTAPLNT